LLTNANTRDLTNTDCDSNGYCDCNGNSDFNRNGDSYSYSYCYCYRDSNVYARSELDTTAYPHTKVRPTTKASANSAASPVAGGTGGTRCPP
jgi:hypothetical protein